MRAMNTVGPLVCPILVGRDDLLALAERRLDDAREGRGHVLFLAGEAGIGKTRLLGSIERRAATLGFRIARGGTYPGDLEVPGAVFLEVARMMCRTPALAAIGEQVTSRLAGADRVTDGTDGDAHRRRRLLTLDVADDLAGVAADGPTMLCLEDLHQADDLTLEIVANLARRAVDLPLLVLVTYRSDELYPRVPMREWRARLLAQRQAEEARLRRLDLAETATMASVLLASGEPAPRDIAAAIHARTDGIPLHVEELIGLLGASGTANLSATAQDVPDTLEAAILGRFGLRSAEAQSVARIGSVIGRSFEYDLLAGVVGETSAEGETLDAPLAELADHFLLAAVPASGRYGFRHALICDAIYARIPDAERRRLHAGSRRLPRSAGTSRTRSCRSSSSGPASGTRRSRRHAGRGRRRRRSPPIERRSNCTAGPCATRRAACSRPSGLRCSRHTPARRRRSTTTGPRPRASRRRETPGCGPIGPSPRPRPWCPSSMRSTCWARTSPRAPAAWTRHWPRSGPSRRRAARPAVELRPVRPRPGPPAGSRRGSRPPTCSAGSWTRGSRTPRPPGRLPSRPGTTPAAQRRGHAGGCLAFRGDVEASVALLERQIAGARTAGAEAEASRGYRMLGSVASVIVEYERGERWLRDGIDLGSASTLERPPLPGRSPRARPVGHRALGRRRGGCRACEAGRARRDHDRITADHVLGFVALGRGELDRAAASLEDARAAGERMGELQRLSPALWGLAEIALLRRDAPAATRWAQAGRLASLEVHDAAYLFPFAVTGTRAYLAAADPSGAGVFLDEVEAELRHRSIPGTLPAIDHARGLLALHAGSTVEARRRLTAAADGWAARGRAWENAWARLDLARAYQRANPAPGCGTARRRGGGPGRGAAERAAA